jgi:hypothetical protein
MALCVSVIPSKAGIQPTPPWIPAFDGKTMVERRCRTIPLMYSYTLADRRAAVVPIGVLLKCVGHVENGLLVEGFAADL